MWGRSWVRALPRSLRGKAQGPLVQVHHLHCPCSVEPGVPTLCLTWGVLVKSLLVPSTSGLWLPPHSPAEPPSSPGCGPFPRTASCGCFVFSPRTLPLMSLALCSRR